MKREAFLALTEAGASNLNRLRAPELRVVRLFVKKSGQSSSHLPRYAPGPAPGGSDDRLPAAGGMITSPEILSDG